MLEPGARRFFGFRHRARFVGVVEEGFQGLECRGFVLRHFQCRHVETPPDAMDFPPGQFSMTCWAPQSPTMQGTFHRMEL